MIPGMRNHARAKREELAALKAAVTAADLAAAVGNLGTVVERADGSWIAIAYRDTHSMPGYYSCAVARCSDGSYYESSIHYCGLFGIFTALQKEQLEDERTPEEFWAAQCDGSPQLGELRRVAVGPSLGDAQASLLALGFHRARGAD
jgi:hypothetical protein